MVSQLRVSRSQPQPRSASRALASKSSLPCSVPDPASHPLSSFPPSSFQRTFTEYLLCACWHGHRMAERGPACHTLTVSQGDIHGDQGRVKRILPFARGKRHFCWRRGRKGDDWFCVLQLPVTSSWEAILLSPPPGSKALWEYPGCKPGLNTVSQPHNYRHLGLDNSFFKERPRIPLSTVLRSKESTRIKRSRKP